MFNEFMFICCLCYMLFIIWSVILGMFYILCIVGMWWVDFVCVILGYLWVGEEVMVVDVCYFV